MPPAILEERRICLNLRVVTLCGSTKFKKQFREAEASLTLKGNIVISLGFFEQSEGIVLTQEQEALFEEMHYRKIDLSDQIYVIDVNGYIGESTRKEIDYARRNGKVIRYYSESLPNPSGETNG